MEDREIRISGIFKILKKRWTVIFSFTLIATAFAGIISYYIIVPQYRSSTKFLIGKQISENEKYNASDIQAYQKFFNSVLA